MGKRLPSVGKAVSVAARHIASGLLDPQDTRAFLRYVAAYDDGRAPHLIERSLHDIYPSIDGREVTLRHRFEPWALPYGEALVLAQITAQIQPKTVFEIGTFTGGATTIMAQHSPADAKIYTLDLPPERLRLPGQQAGTGVRIGERFQGTPYEAKIKQLFGDSASFDFSPYGGEIDLVFVDAVHTYEYVLTDSQAALAMLSGTGVIIWDDCCGEQPGVVKALNEIGASMPIYRIVGTRFALHRASDVAGPSAETE